MRKAVKLFCVFMAAMIVLTALSGCGGAEKPAAEKEASSSGKVDASPSEKQSDKSSETSKGPIILKVGRPEDVSYWDMNNHFNLVNWSIGRLLYDQLIRRNNDGTYSPHLATEWSCSEDGLSWSFTLREGVTFTNGEPLDAYDVQYTIERFVNEKNLRQAPNWTYLKNVDVQDEYHCTVNFTQPNGAFLSIISELSILPKDTIAEMGLEKFFTAPIGSGPYKFKSWTQGSLIVFEKNENYWGEPGKADIIEYHTISDDNTRVSAFLAGDLYWVDNVPGDQVAIIEELGDTEIIPVNTWDAIYLGLKCDTKPFDDINFRKALSLAIDRQAIVDKILGGGAAARWIVGEGVVGYNPDAKVPEQNIEEAKALVQASAYDGRELSFVGPTTWYARTSEVMQYIASCWNEIGVKVKIELLDGATFTDRRAGGDYDIYYTGCSHVGGDPILYLNQRIVQDTMKSGYKNEKLNSMILDVYGETDPKARDAKMREIFQIMMDEYAPHLFLYSIQNTVAKKKNVTGDIIYKDKIIDFSHATIE
ncbi:MAG: ABC transporter substrate-binding protein [Bacillota bacterium]